MKKSCHKRSTVNPPTITEACQWLEQQWPLSVHQPSLAIWLLSFITGYTTAELITLAQQPLSIQQWHSLQKITTKLKKNYPLAYILHEQHFYGRPFKITPAVLIPRPESECLIDVAIQLRQQVNKPTAWLDIGSGSGCLIITLAAELNNKDYFGGSDISRRALRLARHNALSLQQKNIIWRHGTLLRPWLKDNFASAQQIFIIANLPYLTPEEYNYQPSLQYEPRQALVGGPEGLTLFQQLAHELPTFIKYHPDHTINILTEHNTRHNQKLPLLLEIAGLKWQQTFCDLNSQPRFGWWHN